RLGPDLFALVGVVRWQVGAESEERRGRDDEIDCAVFDAGESVEHVADDESGGHYRISSTRTATPGRRPYDFDAWSSTTVESSAMTSPVKASRTARASLSMSGRPGHFGADSLIFWALRPVPKCALGRDR